MRTLSHWLLGGALLASLSWNWTLWQRTGGAPPASCPLENGPVSSPASCALQAPELALDSGRRARLDAVCANSCGESDRLEQQADALQKKLLASLAEPEVDQPAAEALVGQVSELRRQSLAACVQGILEVRRVLAPEEVRTLLDCCERGAAGCRPR